MLWMNPKNVFWGSGLVLISIPESGSRCESHCNFQGKLINKYKKSESKYKPSMAYWS